MGPLKAVSFIERLPDAGCIREYRALLDPDLMEGQRDKLQLGENVGPANLTDADSSLWPSITGKAQIQYASHPKEDGFQHETAPLCVSIWLYLFMSIVNPVFNFAVDFTHIISKPEHIV